MVNQIIGRAREVIKTEATAIEAINLTPVFEDAVVSLSQCSGKVIATGIGKAGIVAQKFAVTLCSTGTPAGFFNSAEAAHGDLGLLDPHDIIVAFSTSGKSREVLKMLTLSRHLVINRIIGITSQPDCELRAVSDIVLDMGQIAEPCSLGLTQTASTAVMLAIGDALALTLMDIKGVTREDYGLRITTPRGISR